MQYCILETIQFSNLRLYDSTSVSREREYELESKKYCRFLSYTYTTSDFFYDYDYLRYDAAEDGFSFHRRRRTCSELFLSLYLSQAILRRGRLLLAAVLLVLLF
jgi:hypothetical protein